MPRKAASPTCAAPGGAGPRLPRNSEVVPMPAGCSSSAPSPELAGNWDSRTPMNESASPDAPSSAASVVRQLQMLWEQGKKPDPDALLRAAGISAPTDVVELLAADQWHRWHAGERVSVEDYLARHPAVANNPTALLALAYGEFL